MRRTQVKDGCLECPFHKWKFDTEGHVTKIPYLAEHKIPAAARTRSYPVREYYGQVMMYFDAEGRDPPYELREFPEIDCGDFVYRGSYTETINMHIQEFAENSADFQHFDPLHGQMTIPWTDIKIPFVTIK